MKTSKRQHALNLVERVTAAIVLLMLVIALGRIVAHAVPAAPARCHGMAATIIGSSGDDVLIGTSHRDVVRLRQGADSFFGLDGNDVICGNRGNDSIDGGSGEDHAYGGKGTDTCNAENRNGCES